MHGMPAAPCAALLNLWTPQPAFASAIRTAPPKPLLWGHPTLTRAVSRRAFSDVSDADFQAAAESEASFAAPSPAEPPTTSQEKPAPKKRGRKKKAPAEAPQPVSREEEAPAEAADPVDLAAGAPRGGKWSGVKRWVVFSDLHVSHKTVDVACQVLRRVREEAEARDAGVLFLGEPSPLPFRCDCNQWLPTPGVKPMLDPMLDLCVGDPINGTIVSGCKLR